MDVKQAILEEYARLQNVMSTWQTISERGTVAGSTLSNSLLSLSYIENDQNWGKLSGDVEVQELAKVKLWNQIGANYKRINGCFNLIEEQGLELQGVLQTIDAIQAYIISQKGADFLSMGFAVGTLTWDNFVGKMQRMIDMYMSDLVLKKKLIMDLRKRPSREEMLVLLSLWSDMPDINRRELDLIQRAIKSESSLLI